MCAPLAGAPEVVAVGDLHVENFGTWRDSEGRLVWGINDFDEAFPMAWTIDLTRLLASVHILCPEGHLKIDAKAAAEIVLGSYRKGLQAGGKPFVLAEEQTPLREMARDRLRDPEKFWRHLEKQRKVKSVPRSARKAFLSALPESGGPGAVCASRVRGWQPGSRTLHCHCPASGRTNRARSQVPRAFGLRLGRPTRQEGLLPALDRKGRSLP